MSQKPLIFFESSTRSIAIVTGDKPPQFVLSGLLPSDTIAICSVAPSYYIALTSASPQQLHVFKKNEDGSDDDGKELFTRTLNSSSSSSSSTTTTVAYSRLVSWHNRVVCVGGSTHKNNHQHDTVVCIVDLLAAEGDYELRTLHTRHHHQQAQQHHHIAQVEAVDSGLLMIDSADGAVRKWSVWDREASSTSGSPVQADAATASTARDDDDDDDDDDLSVIPSSFTAVRLIRTHRGCLVAAHAKTSAPVDKSTPITFFEIDATGDVATQLPLAEAKTTEDKAVVASLSQSLLGQSDHITVDAHYCTDSSSVKAFYLLTSSGTLTKAELTKNTEGEGSSSSSWAVSLSPVDAAHVPFSSGPIVVASGASMFGGELATECALCFDDLTLGDGQAMTLDCGHSFHADCVQGCVDRAELYVGKGQKIVFGMAKCPGGCGVLIRHPRFPRSGAIADRYRLVRQKAIQRGKLEYGGGKRNADDLVDKYLFYVCSKCTRPFWGGNKDCAATVGGEPECDPKLLICEDCNTDFACADHGRQYVFYKCRFCCNPASHLSFGHIRTCERCHVEKRKEAITQCDASKCPIQAFANVVTVEKHGGIAEAVVLGCLACDGHKIDASKVQQPEPQSSVAESA